MIALLLALCAAANEPPGTQIVVHDALTPAQASAWTVYGVQSLGAPGFDGEVLGRTSMLTHWTELQAQGKKKRPAPDPYLDALAAVHQAGFLREYVWVFLRQPGWDVPPGLKLAAFTAWKAEHLPGREAETWARVDTPASPPDPAAADGLAEQAKAAREAGHPTEAVVLASKALEQDPTSLTALWVRGLTLGVLLDQTPDPDARARLAALASADLSAVVRTAPDSPEAAIVRQSYGPQPGLRLPHVPCPPEAVAAYEEAEKRFNLRRFDDALEAYDRALAACPNEPSWWVYSGDALHQLADLRGAVARYDKALAIEPCHWQAHRFRGDVLMHVEPVQARRSYALALACNPGYDVAWKHLHDPRVRLTRPQRGPDGPVLERPAGSELLAPVFDAWQAAFAARASAGDPDADLLALKAAVQAYRDGFPDGGSADWDALRRADDAGFLREAMVLHLFGPDLIPAFLPWRAANLDRMVTYLEAEVIAPF